jgi:hypothetical protein
MCYIFFNGLNLILISLFLSHKNFEIKYGQFKKLSVFFSASNPNL